MLKLLDSKNNMLIYCSCELRIDTSRLVKCDDAPFLSEIKRKSQLSSLIPTFAGSYLQESECSASPQDLLWSLDEI